MPTANATTAAASTRRRRKTRIVDTIGGRTTRGAMSSFRGTWYECVFVNEIHSAGQSEFVYNGSDKRLHNDSHAFKMLWGSTKRSHLTKDNIAFVCIYVWLCSVFGYSSLTNYLPCYIYEYFSLIFSVLKTETKIHCSTFVWFLHHM